MNHFMRNTPLSFDSPLPRRLAESFAATAAASLYGTIVAYRNRYYDWRRSGHTTKIKRPVISIGGIRAGGSGKTPAVMLLAGFLQQLDYEVAVLSRGYKRSVRSPLQVAPGEPVPWKHIGDEPAMIRLACPHVWLGIGSSRSLNAKLLLPRMGERSLFLLDDGFQHRTLHRDLDIVCIHETIFSDRLLPQGFLREPIEVLSRAHIFFLIAAEHRIGPIREVGERLKEQFPAIDQFILIEKKEGWVNLKSGETAQSLPCQTPVAFCGIARPERFFESITACAITPCRKITFPDHYTYTENDFFPMRELYSNGLITTEKDAVRLRELQGIEAEKIWYLKIRLQFSENDSLGKFQHYITNIDQ